MKSGTTESKNQFDIWALAKEVQKKQQQNNNVSKTIIIVGEQNSGKSSFVKVLKADTDVQVKPTCALEYTFVRKSTQKKQILHTYEIAGKNLRGIISSLINKQNYNSLCFVLVVDLSTPQDIVDKTLMWIQIIKDESNKFLQTKIEPKQHNQYYSNVLAKFSDHEDKQKINPIPLNTIIIGNKYDLFQKFDTQARKWISRVLRYIAHTNGCSLFFNSIRVPQLSAQIRTVFQGIFFSQNNNYASLSQKQHLKPIFINTAQDKLNSMNLPHSGSMSMTEALKKHIFGLVPVKAEKKNQEFDFSKYNQSKIDSLVAEKQKQLQKLSKQFRNLRNDKPLEESPEKAVNKRRG